MAHNHHSPSSEIKVVTGSEAACLLPQVWPMLDVKRRDMLLWDVAPQLKARLFPKYLAAADVACLVWCDGQVVGLAWVFGMGRHTRCGVIHMTFWGEAEEARVLGRAFLQRFARDGWQSVLAMLPVPFRHMRRYVADIGMTCMGRLPGACVLAGHNNRVCAGEFWKWEAQA